MLREEEQKCCEYVRNVHTELAPAHKGSCSCWCVCGRESPRASQNARLWFALPTVTASPPALPTGKVKLSFEVQEKSLARQG